VSKRITGGGLVSIVIDVSEPHSPRPVDADEPEEAANEGRGHDGSASPSASSLVNGTTLIHGPYRLSSRRVPRTLSLGVALALMCSVLAVGRKGDRQSWPAPIPTLSLWPGHRCVPGTLAVASSRAEPSAAPLVMGAGKGQAIGRSLGLGPAAQHESGRVPTGRAAARGSS
jgi:hypothetical protein